MAVEIKIPEVGESITEVEIGEWLKAEGDRVERDEVVVTLETDKAAVELPAPESGTLVKILKQAGESAGVGDVIARVEPGERFAAEKSQQKEGAPLGGKAEKGARVSDAVSDRTREEEPEETEEETEKGKEPMVQEGSGNGPAPMPAARRVLAEHGLQAAEVKGTGRGGRVLKEDVLRHVAERGVGESPPRAGSQPVDEAGPREEETVRMSPLRRKVAARLVEAQRNAALLTTFNEIDMGAVMALREEHREAFQERYSVKLGIMSFFVKAAVDALGLIPQVNAEVRDGDIVYRNYYDIGIAVGSGRGLVVPVLRNAERMSFSEIEIAIADFAHRAQENRLKLEELEGGTFTISNGGVYGSLLSTPIVNPPQSGILGMHAIQKRPVVQDDQVVIRPMMYVALTYDHRIVDGREAVTFLRRIKECVESPSRMLLEV